MKLIQKIIQISRTLLIPCCLLTSCNYLDVIPPAQADFDDTMKDEAATLNFLFTCYGYIPRVHPFEFKAFEQSADELISPKMWDDYQQQVAWGTISPSYYNSWGGDDMNIWTPSYNWLGYVHHFLSLIDELQPTGVTEDDKAQYKAECYFLEAYYHFRVLQAFGPCPLITEKVDPNITNDQIPGRSHFDYCVNYIVGKLMMLQMFFRLQDRQKTSAVPLPQSVNASKPAYCCMPLLRFGTVLSIRRTGRIRIMKRRTTVKSWSATLTTARNGPVH